MIQSIQGLIDAIDGGVPRFPPTILFNEGWMLRLVLDRFQTLEAPAHPLSFLPLATWFSEALLPSHFRARYRGDRRAEARTHADGIIGHFDVGGTRKADVNLHRGAMQLVVIEAKMRSSLSPGTRNAPTYDQAARSAACIAEVLSRAERRPEKMESLKFVVAAPQENIAKGEIHQRLEKSSIEAAVRDRAQAFFLEMDPWFEQWFLPALEHMTIMAISWEQILADIRTFDEPAGRDLDAFYERCLQYN